jgi:hypothetical protein
MSRPKPKILLEYANKDTFKVEQILDSEAIWAVFYKAQPFNLKSGSLVASYPGPKYKKVSFLWLGVSNGYFCLEKYLSISSATDTVPSLSPAGTEIIHPRFATNKDVS